MRQPCRGTFNGAPSDDLGVLVATDIEGYRRICTEVCVVPKARLVDPSANK